MTAGLRRAVLALGTAIGVLSLAAEASAQAYPSRPIRLVMPFGAGSASDTIARIVADKLGAQLGQRVLIENKAGAGGNLGTAEVARAEPDGYSLIFAAPGPFAINRTLETLPYDPEADFEHIALVARLANVLVVNPKRIPVATVPEFIAFLKERAGQISYASLGRGSTQHLAAALFDVVAGTRMVHVPYKSGSQVAVDLVSGDVPVNFSLIPNVAAYLPSGELRALAVTTKERSRSLPDVPTMAEQGVTNYESYAWFGISAPKGTPAPILDRLNAELVKAMADPTVQARLVEIGVEPASSSREEFRAFISSQIVTWRDTIQAAGIKAE